jgi:hypothetical protein
VMLDVFFHDLLVGRGLVVPPTQRLHLQIKSPR